MLWSLGEAGLAGGLQGAAQQQPTHVLRGHSAPVQCVAISSAMRLAVSGSHDGTTARHSNPNPNPNPDPNPNSNLPPEPDPGPNPDPETGTRTLSPTPDLNADRGPKPNPESLTLSPSLSRYRSAVHAARRPACARAERAGGHLGRAGGPRLQP